MSSIKNLEMANALSALSCVTIKKSLFGQTAVYEPTQSPLKVKTLEYAPAEGERMERLLKLPMGNLMLDIQKNGKPQPTVIGHHRLEVCVSKDQQFVALQLFAFVDFKYNAVTELLTYEGDNAAVILQLI